MFVKDARQHMHAARSSGGGLMAVGCPSSCSWAVPVRSHGCPVHLKRDHGKHCNETYHCHGLCKQRCCMFMCHAIGVDCRVHSTAVAAAGTPHCLIDQLRHCGLGASIHTPLSTTWCCLILQAAYFAPAPGLPGSAQSAWLSAWLRWLLLVPLPSAAAATWLLRDSIPSPSDFCRHNACRHVLCYMAVLQILAVKRVSSLWYSEYVSHVQHRLICYRKRMS
jgi:hypothetical protein